jgi:hypothetical protein
MARLTVTKVGEPKPKETQYGILYGYMVFGTMDGEDTSGFMRVKDPNNAPKVGQEIEVEVQVNDYGNVFKKINNFGNAAPTTTPTKPQSYQRDYKAEEIHKYPSFALSYSKDIMVALINNGYYEVDGIKLSNEEIQKEWFAMAAMTHAWLLADDRPVGEINYERD